MYSCSLLLGITLVMIGTLGSCKRRARLPDGYESELENAKGDPKRGQGTLENGVQFTSEEPAAIARQRPSANRQADRQWGTPYNIDVLKSAARRLYFESTVGTGSQHLPDPLVVGDMSLRKGGEIAGHASHEVGLDTDISFYDKRGRTRQFERGSAKPLDRFLNYVVENQDNFDVERNLRFVELLHEEASRCGNYIQFIFADQVLIRRMHQSYSAQSHGLSLKEFSAKFALRHWPNHQNHFHVRMGYLNSENCRRPAPLSQSEALDLKTRGGYGTPLDSSQGSGSRTGPLGANDIQQDSPYGDNCGIYVARSNVEAVVSDILEDDGDGQRPENVVIPEVGKRIDVQEGSHVVCVKKFTTKSGRSMKFYLSFPDTGAGTTSPYTLTSKAEFFRRVNDVEAQRWATEVDGVEPVDESFCRNAGEDILEVEDGPINLHEIDTVFHGPGMLDKVLQRGALLRIKESGMQGVPAGWVTVEVLNGPAKGRTGLVWGDYLTNFTESRCQERRETERQVVPSRPPAYDQKSVKPL